MNIEDGELDEALILYADAATRRSAITIGAAAGRIRPHDPDSLITEMTDVLRRTENVQVPPRVDYRENMTEKSVTAFREAFPELSLRAVDALANLWAYHEYS